MQLTQGSPGFVDLFEKVATLQLSIEPPTSDRLWDAKLDEELLAPLMVAAKIATDLSQS